MSELRAAANFLATGPVGHVAELAAYAESLGYSRIWLADEGLHTRDVFVTLTAVAVATEQVLIGPGITNPYTRHPGVTAAAVASVDEVSGGRAFVGIGAGGGLALGPLGIERRRPLRAVEEMVAALRGLWAGEPVTIDGDTLSLHEARLSYARPDLQIHVTGRGPRMVELAGRVADGFYLSYVYKPLIGDLLERVRSGGRDINFTYCTQLATDDSTWEAARRGMTFRLVDSPPEVREAVGISPANLDALKAALAEGGPHHAAPLVRDEWIEPFVIAGTPDECSAELQALADQHGFHEFLIVIDDLDTGADVLERVAGIVQPSDPGA